MLANRSKVFFLAILAFFASSVFAKPVSQNEAQNIAENLQKTKKYSAKLKHKKMRSRQPKMAAKTIAAETNALYYVFDIGEKNGFAIIAGDDVFKPVLGISENGNFDYADMPPNFAWYLQNLENELEYALQSGETADSEAVIEWKAYASSAPYMPGTFLIETKWHQQAPYNNMCPLVSGSRAVAGCEATSMSQVMKYHEWPLSISGEIPQYETKTSSVFVPAISRENFSYDWENMANYYSSQATPAQEEAVAAITRHAGAAVKMDYSAKGSGAYSIDIPHIMPLYFAYDKNIKFISRNGRYIRPEDYMEVASGLWRPANDSILPYVWDDIMRMQIDSLLPVIYSGSSEDKEAGHSFILDGYDNSGKFHFNWGWGGQYDGWFASSVLTPSSQNFSSNQDAVINIMPNLYRTKNSDLRIFGKNLTAKKSSVALGEFFDVNAAIYNIGAATLPRGKTLGIAILNPSSEEDFEIIGTVELDSVMSFNRARKIANSNLRGDYSLDIESIVLPSILPGNYILKAAIKNENDEWEFIKSATKYLDYANIKVSEEFAPDNSSLELCEEITLAPVERDSLYESLILQGKPLEIGFGVKNTGTGPFVGRISAEFSSDLNSGAEKIGENITIILAGGSCEAISLNSGSIVSEDGEYILSAISENLAGEKKLLNQIPVYVWDSSSCLPSSRCGYGCAYPAAQFCFDEEVYDKCDGEIYNPETQFCSNGEVKSNKQSIIASQTTGQIYIHLAGNAIVLENLPSGAKIEAYNLRGQQIYAGKNSLNSKRLKIPVHTKGVYIIKISAFH